jgi:hypothetical protein
VVARYIPYEHRYTKRDGCIWFDIFEGYATVKACPFVIVFVNEPIAGSVLSFFFAWVCKQANTRASRQTLLPFRKECEFHHWYFSTLEPVYVPQLDGF